MLIADIRAGGDMMRMCTITIAPFTKSLARLGGIVPELKHGIIGGCINEIKRGPVARSGAASTI